MAKFIYAFHGGSMPATEAERDEVMAAWGTWMQGLGSALVDPGAPVGMSKTLSASGVTNDGGSNPLSGYSVVEAADIDAAIEMAKGCPIHGNGGSVEVAEILPM